MKKINDFTMSIAISIAWKIAIRIVPIFQVLKFAYDTARYVNKLEAYLADLS